MQSRANAIPSLTIVAGGGADDREGYFVAPTILLGDDPTDDAFRTEYFGPILAVHVYDDAVPGALKRVFGLDGAPGLRRAAACRMR